MATSGARKKERYIVSTIGIIETLITFAMKICDEDTESREKRDVYRSKLNNLHGKESLVGSFAHAYNDIRNLRNSFAHPVKTDGKNDSDNKNIALLEEKIKGIVSLYRNNYYGDSQKAIDNKNNLIEALNKTR